MTLQTMKRDRRARRALNGVLLLDKQTGYSSNDSLQRIKRFYGAAKAGHTGSLDPLATGMLPICFGEATKFSQFLLDADKSYTVTARLGVRTTTSDSEGEVVSTRPVPELSVDSLDDALATFRGKSSQVPSMYSALKYQGKPLYQYARAGITVDRPSRLIELSALSIDHYADDLLTLSLRCSKGTYVRTLIDDLGERLGCGAHVVALRRTSVSGFEQSDMVGMDVLEGVRGDIEALDQYLKPMSVLVSNMPKLMLTDGDVMAVRHGQRPMIDAALMPKGEAALYDQANRFLGVGELLDGRLITKRLLSSQCVLE